MYDDWKLATPKGTGMYFTYEINPKPVVVNVKFEEYMRKLREKNQLKNSNK